MQGTPKILLKDQQQLMEQDMVQDMNRNYTGSLINMTEVRKFSEVAEKKKLTPPAEELQHSPQPLAVPQLAEASSRALPQRLFFLSCKHYLTATAYPIPTAV